MPDLTCKTSANAGWERTPAGRIKVNTVKRRAIPMLAVIVDYDVAAGRKGKILASEPIKTDFANSDAEAAARRLVLLVLDRDIILPTGMSL